MSQIPQPSQPPTRAQRETAASRTRGSDDRSSRPRGVAGGFTQAGAPGLNGAAVGVAVIVFSAVYLVSDVIELAQGGFSTTQLVLTYLSEAALPLLVLALYAVQCPQIGRLGLVGAVTYAFAYTFFTGTVVYALATATPDWSTLQAELDPWMTVHGVLLIAAGVAFGVAVVRARVLPAWTGWALVAGVVLVAAASGLGDLPRTLAAAVRDLAFIGMGAALLTRTPGRRS